jgi:hypothetical protein
MIDRDDIAKIDEARRNGLTYDAVVSHIAAGGLPQHEAKRVVDAYLKVPDGHGRPRANVNPGDPGWRP